MVFKASWSMAMRPVWTRIRSQAPRILRPNPSVCATGAPSAPSGRLPPCSTGVVEDDPDDMAMAVEHAAHAVPHRELSHAAAPPGHGPPVDAEDDRVALRERHDIGALL